MDASKRCQWCWICGPGAPKSDRNIEVHNSWQHPLAVRLMQILALVNVSTATWWWRRSPPLVLCTSVGMYAAHIPWFWCRNQPHPKIRAFVQGALRGTCNAARRSKACKALGHWAPSSAALVVIFLLVVFILARTLVLQMCAPATWMTWLPNMVHQPRNFGKLRQKTSPSRVRPRFQTSNQGAASYHVWLNLLDGHLFGQGQRHEPHLRFAKGANGSVECIAVALNVSIRHVEQQLGNSLPTALSFTSFDGRAECKCIGLQVIRNAMVQQTFDFSDPKLWDKQDPTSPAPFPVI